MPRRRVPGVWSMNWWSDLRLNETVVRSLTAVAEQYLHLVHQVPDGACSSAEDAGTLVKNIVSGRLPETGWRPRGRLSANGHCHLMPTADGQWVALNLARPGDVDIIRAVFHSTPTDSAGQDAENFALAVATWRVEELLEATRDLGIPLSRVGEVEWDGSLADLPVRRRPVETTRSSPSAGCRESREPVKVLDLSSLWAGPLSSLLLRDAGCAVTTVESSRRPDPTRWRHPSFHADLHRGKHRVQVDFIRERDRLATLIAESDVVIESSRPRALARLGMTPDFFLGTGRPRIWVSITGYGTHGGDSSSGAALRVGFGDDCAAAGGLVDWSAEGPCFVGDALADPLTGLIAATEVLGVLRSEKGRSGCHMRVSLAECANWVARGGGLHSHRRD